MQDGCWNISISVTNPAVHAAEPSHSPPVLILLFVLVALDAESDRSVDQIDTGDTNDAGSVVCEGKK